MKKTVNINIGRMAFTIDEDAFMILENYLNQIKAQFSEAEQADILEDIEARIAELFSEKLNETHAVISLENVQSVIQKMGRPEQISGNEGVGNAVPSSENTETTQVKKKLYRNPDDKVFTGVIGGLCTYFGKPYDATIVRLIVVGVLISLMVFDVLDFLDNLIPFTFLSYIVLSIIIPKAKTTTQKLQMLGTTPNIAGIAEKSTELRNTTPNKYAEKVNTGVDKFFKGVLMFLGIVLVGFGVYGLYDILSSIFFPNEQVTLFRNAINDFVLQYPSSNWMSSLAFFILGVVPCLLILLIGARILIQKPFLKTRYFLALFGLFILGSILIGYTVSREVKNFVTQNEVEENFNLDIPKEKTLHLSAIDFVSFKKFDESSLKEIIKKDSILVPLVELEILPSNTGKAYLLKTTESQGKNKEDAKLNASAASYGFQIQDSGFVFNPYVAVVKGKAKFRVQRVLLSLYVPEGQQIFVDKSINAILKDAEITQNSRAVMEKNGIKYLDADVKSKKDIHVYTNGKNVSIKNKSTSDTEEDTDTEELEDAKQEIEEAKEAIREAQEQIKEATKKMK